MAAFDVGTNTVQVTVAETDGRTLSSLLERSDITRLGEGVRLGGVLSQAAMERTLVALERFAEEARALGAIELFGGATSAAREARNGPAFMERVRERTGIALRILSGEEEAQLTFLAAQRDFGAVGRTLVAVDIGGGSTEVVFGDASGAPIFGKSLKVGSVRLTERWVTAHPIPLEEQEALRRAVAEVLREVPPAPSESELVAIAATATTLLAVDQELEERQGASVHGGVLRTAALRRHLAALCALPLQARSRLRGVDPRRADVLCAGGFILLGVLEHLGMDSCRVTDRGVRWGLLWDRLR